MTVNFGLTTTKGPVFFLVVLNIDDEKPLPDIDLRCREADARGIVHGLEHVVDQLLKEGVLQFLGMNALGHLTQGRMTVFDDFTNVRHDVIITQHGKRRLQDVGGAPLRVRRIVVVGRFAGRSCSRRRAITEAPRPSTWERKR